MFNVQSKLIWCCRQQDHNPLPKGPISKQVSLIVRSIRQSERPWRFKSGALFERLDGFRARLHGLQDMFQSAAAFGRLERIEIGGYQVRARSLSHCHLEGQSLHYRTSSQLLLWVLNRDAAVSHTAIWYCLQAKGRDETGVCRLTCCPLYVSVSVTIKCLSWALSQLTYALLGCF